MTGAPLKVSQAAREAAADHGRMIGHLSKKDADAVLAGKWDETSFVQSFARFEAQIREECAAIAREELENRRADLKRDLFNNFVRGQINAAERIEKTMRMLTGDFEITANQEPSNG